MPLPHQTKDSTFLYTRHMVGINNRQQIFTGKHEASFPKSQWPGDTFLGDAVAKGQSGDPSGQNQGSHSSHLHFQNDHFPGLQKVFWGSLWQGRGHKRVIKSKNFENSQSRKEFQHPNPLLHDAFLRGPLQCLVKQPLWRTEGPVIWPSMVCFQILNLHVISSKILKIWKRRPYLQNSGWSQRPRHGCKQLV